MNLSIRLLPMFTSLAIIAAIGVPVRATLPRSELSGVIAVHPLCAGDGADAGRLAAPFCDAVAGVLALHGRQAIEIVPRNDARLGTDGHVVLGFTLADARIGGARVVLVSARLVRADRPDARLLPPPAEWLPADADRATRAAAAARLVQALGFQSPKRSGER